MIELPIHFEMLKSRFSLQPTGSGSEKILVIDAIMRNKVLNVK